MDDSNQITVRYPLLPIACGFIGGIVAGKYTGGDKLWIVLGLVCFGGCLAAFGIKHLRQLAGWLVVASVFCFGGAYSAHTYYTVPDNHVVTYCPRAETMATLRGKIVSSVKIFGDHSIPGYQRPPRTSFLIEAQQIQTDRGWDGVCGLVRATIAQPARQLQTGQHVELVGTIKRVRQQQNPGQRDPEKLAHRTRVFVRMFMKLEKSAAVLSNQPPGGLQRTLNNLRAGSREHLLVSDDLYEGHLLNALLLGHRDKSLRQLNRTMAKAGIAHYLSISGLHFGIFLWFIYLLCRAVALRPATSAAVVLALVSGYLLIVEPRPALLRSAMMAGALCLAVITGRKYAALNALGLAAIVLACIDPMVVFNPGFQLSFAIVFGIILLHREMMDLMFGWVLRNRGLVVHRNKNRVVRRVRRTVGYWLMSLFTLGVTAWLVSVPLTAYMFSRFSPYAAGLSVILLPLVVLVLIPGYIAILLQVILPGLAGMAQRWALWAAGLLDKAVGLFESLPGLSIELYPVNMFWVLVCYAVILITVFHRRFRAGRLATVGGIVFLGVFTAILQLPAKDPPGLEVNLLAVSSGQCAVCRTPDGTVFLVDAGTQSSWDAYNEALLPFLQARKIPEPSQAFVSHDNIDHYNILSNLPADSNIKKLLVHPWFAKSYGPTSSPAKLLKNFETPSRKIQFLKAPDTGKIDDSTIVQVLWPTQYLPDQDTNDTSLVLRFTCNGRSILFCGDIEQSVQEQLLADPGLLKSDVLVLPHHGAWNPSLERFIEAVGPEVVLVSSSKNRINAYANDPTNQARREFYDKINQKYRYHSTTSNGWICVSLGKYAPISVKAMR